MLEHLNQDSLRYLTTYLQFKDIHSFAGTCKFWYVELELFNKFQISLGDQRERLAKLSEEIKYEKDGLRNYKLQQQQAEILMIISFGMQFNYSALRSGRFNFVNSYEEAKTLYNQTKANIEIKLFENYNLHSYEQAICKIIYKQIKVSAEKLNFIISHRESSYGWVDGYSLLQHAIKAQNHYVVEQLLASNYGGIDMKNSCGDTALHIATKFGSVQSILLLAKHRANFSIPNSELKTPVEIIHTYPDIQCKRFLLLLAQITVDSMFGQKVNQRILWSAHYIAYVLERYL
ncbi:MAG: hypothetical protein K0R73_1455 [Candidatus Midichloriaceae bacterium]|nr:hypothetical protein [Candidatus Midichloriaceae bacterium]